MSGLRIEGMAFLTAVLTGMILVCGYTCIRKFRRVITHSSVMIAIEDGLYWLITSIYVFLQIFRTSNGSIRWYFVAGVVIGCGIFWKLSRMLSWILRKSDEKEEEKLEKTIEFNDEKR